MNKTFKDAKKVYIPNLKGLLLRYCVTIHIEICRVLHHKLLAMIRCIYLSPCHVRIFKVFFKIFLSDRLLSFKETLNTINLSKIIRKVNKLSFHHIGIAWIICTLKIFCCLNLVLLLNWFSSPI